MPQKNIPHYICIHGHFYQPPRENPWLEAIELQDSAYPYRDWNERITAECYAPNAASRILDENNEIINIINNFSKISFNFGATLLSWMEKYEPEVYQAILYADRLSQKYFSGHGAAIAQAYNHMILPIANEGDKRSQVIWGIKDFESRFKRFPEGMWLPETAVDTLSLEVLAEQGIKFTILAPNQMSHFRRLGDKEWRSVKDQPANMKRPYLVRLPSGRQITIFFYDGNISHDIAFGGLLNNGEAFANRLVNALNSEPDDPRLLHIATDGETYGHHHRFGNMALSYCLHYIESRQLGKMSVYGEFLELHPAEYEAKIVEKSSWSCSHGVERWQADCGCSIGSHAGWNQKWRAPLKKSLDRLRDQTVPLFEEGMKHFFKDPWEVRDSYIQVVLNRSDSNVETFIKQFALVDLKPVDRVKIIEMLELQRQAMYMYTSCGWFFDDISGIETVQVIEYAARVIQLAKKIYGEDFEAEFREGLATAPGNLPEWADGKVVYEKKVQPSIIELIDVGAHYAISSLFEDYPVPAKIYAFTIQREDYSVYETGKQRLVIGKARITSDITSETCLVEFSVLHLGDYNLYCGVREEKNASAFDLVHARLRGIFQLNNIPGVIQVMNEYFGSQNYSLWDLFKNEQEKVLKKVFNNTLGSIEAHFREIYEHYYPLMQLKPDFRIPLPKALAMSVEFILNRDMIDALEGPDPDLEKLQKIAREIKRWSFIRDMESLCLVAAERIHALMKEVAMQPRNLKPLKTLCRVMEILQPLNLPLNIWKSQNVYFSVLTDVYTQMLKHAQKGDDHDWEWLSLFEELGRHLKVKRAVKS